MYDYLIVGSGIFGAVCARELTNAGKKVCVIEKRPHIAGNIYTKCKYGIHIHCYGAHIFHTNDPEVWNYVNQYASFNRFTNSPIANYKGEIYSLPFNMYTFNRMWGVITPEEARSKIEDEKKGYISEICAEKGISPDEFVPENLEEQAISLVGTGIYEKLIRGYTEKQWGRACDKLPPSIIRRLPVRFNYDNNYFNALFQGIPTGGYTGMISNMLDGIEVRTETDYLNEAVRNQLKPNCRKVIYTGPIDSYFDYRFGALEYRSLRFEEELIQTANYQGNAVVNYTDEATPYTRIIEHKWFHFGLDDRGAEIPATVITREYSHEWNKGEESYYPIGDEKNLALFKKYCELAKKEPDTIFGGRLGTYRYMDMDATVRQALDTVHTILIHTESTG